jgi:hypothetical protein
MNIATGRLPLSKKLIPAANLDAGSHVRKQP